MKAKRFFLGAVALAAALALLLSAGLAALDPFFVVRGLEEGQRAYFTNERYQAPGLIRNQDYTVLLMGTSLVANYRASWFQEGLGEKTLKVTFPNGKPSEFTKALELAFATHPDIDRVYFGMDLNMLVGEDDGALADLPLYLYNTEPWDDVGYFLNKESYIEAAKSAVKRARGEAVELDGAYIWDGTVEFSRAHALAVYYRQNWRDPAEPAETYLPQAERTVDVLSAWAADHPDTTFVFWSAPYSILYWDYLDRSGKREAYLTALEYAWERLSALDNVEVYSFLGREDIITQLDYYTDYIHCAGSVTYLEAVSMMAQANPITPESIPFWMGRLRELVEHYDYDSLFAGEA